MKKQDHRGIELLKLTNMLSKKYGIDKKKTKQTLLSGGISGLLACSEELGIDERGAGELKSVLAAISLEKELAQNE